MPLLMLVTGLPATGKSTIARNLARQLGGALLSTDRIRRRLLEKPSYTPEEKQLIYRAMFLVAEYLLRSRVNVVLDGTFYLRSLRREAYNLASSSRGRLVVVECVCPEEVVKRRLKMRRGRSLSDADYQVYLKLKAEYEPIRRKHITADTSKPLRQSLREIMSAMNQNR